MATDQQFCLRWNNHQSTLISVFDSLLENGTLVDCTLAAEGQYLKAHKVVLSACSPYLETLLSQHYEKHPIVILKDVKFTELKSMMDYMYRGEVNISQDQLGTFLKAAESLQIKGLSDNGDDGAGPTTTKRQDSSRSTVTEVRNVESKRPAPSMDLSDASREGSISPSSSMRKRRRTRRSSQGDDPDSHLDATSNVCDFPNQSTPLPVPSTTVVPTPVQNIPKQIVKQEPSISRIDNSLNSSIAPESGLLKEKIEPPSEPLLEPKTEYLEYMNNENSIEVEDLTLDDDEDLDSSMDASRPGPSHGDMSNQGYQWPMGDQSGTDEIFMAAQQAVGAATGQQRDSQDASQPDDVQYVPQSKIKARVGVLCSNCGSIKRDKGQVVHKVSCCDYLENRKEFKCQCGLTLQSKKLLSIHKVTCGAFVGNIEKAFSCNCGKTFSSKRGYTIHKRICTYTSPINDKTVFICACGRKCSTLGGLSNHKKYCIIKTNAEVKSYLNLKQNINTEHKQTSLKQNMNLFTETVRDRLVRKMKSEILPKRRSPRNTKTTEKNNTNYKNVSYDIKKSSGTNINHQKGNTEIDTPRSLNKGATCKSGNLMTNISPHCLNAKNFNEISKSSNAPCEADEIGILKKGIDFKKEHSNENVITSDIAVDHAHKTLGEANEVPEDQNESNDSQTLVIDLSSMDFINPKTPVKSLIKNVKIREGYFDKVLQDKTALKEYQPNVCVEDQNVENKTKKIVLPSLKSSSELHKNDERGKQQSEFGSTIHSIEYNKTAQIVNTSKNFGLHGDTLNYALQGSATSSMYDSIAIATKTKYEQFDAETDRRLAPDSCLFSTVKEPINKGDVDDLPAPTLSITTHPNELCTKRGITQTFAQVELDKTQSCELFDTEFKFDSNLEIRHYETDNADQQSYTTFVTNPNWTHLDIVNDFDLSDSRSAGSNDESNTTPLRAYSSTQVESNLLLKDDINSSSDHYLTINADDKTGVDVAVLNSCVVRNVECNPSENITGWRKYKLLRKKTYATILKEQLKKKLSQQRKYKRGKQLNIRRILACHFCSFKAMYFRALREHVIKCHSETIIKFLREKK